MYRILTAIGDSFRGEVGTEGVRRQCLTSLQIRLAGALTLAKEFAARGPNTKVAAGLPEVGSGRVKALIDFHKQQQHNTIQGDLLNAEVIRIRQWIFRQQARLTPDGEIIWPRSVRTVEYDTQLAQRNLTRIRFRGGLMYTAENKPIDTTQMVTAFSGPGYAIYVMSQEGHIHVSSHAVGYRHHSSMLAGDSVAGAGEIQVKAGRLVWLSNKSGHYRPDLFQLVEVLHQLQGEGVPMTFQVRELPADKTHPNVNAFMVANGFDDGTYEIDQIMMAYRDYLNPEFYRRNHLAVLKIEGQSGIYDLTSNPPRRVSLDEFERNMAAGGMKPAFMVKNGRNR